MKTEAEKNTGKSRVSKVRTVVQIVAILIFVAIVAAIGVPMYISHVRTSCDRAAAEDVESLGAALKRFADERKEQGCDLKQLPPEILEYLVGPKYGWDGTNHKCDVLIRIDGDVVRACSTRGSHPELDPKIRYLYGVNLLTGEFVQWTKGECSGEAYGGRGAERYVNSALGPGCTVQKPKRLQ